MPPKAPRAKPATAKPKPAAKPAGTKAAAKVTSVKTTDENNRFNAAVHAGVEGKYIFECDEINNRNFQEKCGQKLALYILEAIDYIQKTEVVDHEMPNTFPNDAYNLLDDKCRESKEVSHKKAVNRGTTEPKQKRQPSKISAQVVVEEPEPEPEVESLDEDKKEATEESTLVIEDLTEAKKAKKNICQINRNGKTWLGFIVNRFTMDTFNSSGGKAIKTDKEFVTLMFNTVTKDISSHFSRSVLSTVSRLGVMVNEMKDHEFSAFLTSKIGSIFEHPDENRPFITPYLVRFIVTYFKLLGHVIATYLWTKHKSTITGSDIEMAIRMLDMGNTSYQFENKLVDSENPPYGIQHGFYVHGRAHDNLLNPPPTEEEKAKRAASHNKAKASKAKSAVDGADGVEATEEDAAAEAEAEEAAQQEADQAAEEAADGEEPADGEEAADGEEPVEEEAVPAPAPVKKAPAKAAPTKAAPTTGTANGTHNNGTAKPVRKMVPA